MGNTFTSTNTEYISNLVLDTFVSYLAPLRAFTLDCSPAQSFIGATVPVLTVSTSSAAQDYVSTYQIQGATATSTVVTLNKHKFVSWELLDSEWRDSGLLSMESFAKSRGAALAEAVLTDVFSYMTASFNASKVCPVASFSASFIADISLELDNLKTPQVGRSLILNPTYHTALRKDSALQNASSYWGSEVIRNGQVPSIDTFENVYKTHMVPATSNHIGLAVVPNAMVFASRTVAPQEPNSYNYVQVLTDEESGISITALRYHDPLVGSQRMIFTTEYGFNIANQSGSIRLLSA